MFPRFTTLAGALANNRHTRLVLIISLALMPLSLATLLAEAPMVFVAATVASAITDGLLRMAPMSRGRLLRVVRDRAAQASTLRIALIAFAMVYLADVPVAAVVTGAGLIGSLLCRVTAGWLNEKAGRGEDDAAAGRSSEREKRAPWSMRTEIGLRYTRGLTVSELSVLGALAVALAGGADGWVVAIAALAWLPSMALPVVAAWQWLQVVRGRDLRLSESLPAARVAVYFAEPVSRAYQLQQWLPVLADIHHDLSVSLVFRDRRTFDVFGELTTLPRIFAPTIDDLVEVYTGGDPAVVLYVNNGWRNFQSLAWPRSLHAHINHGESDKTSLVTHQFRAYDRILVAGPTAVTRMSAGLLEVALASVVVVGRPQLDYVDVDATALRDLTGPALVYAPTWEGENDANNFSSLDVGGPEIVRALLQTPGATVLYKPHPRSPGSPHRVIRDAHRAICRQLDEAAARNPGAAHAQWTGDVLPLLARGDVLVSDVSSVAVDHLYLRPDAGLILMDRGRDGGDVRAAEIPVARAATVVRADRLDGLGDTIVRLLGDDGQQESRVSVRREYFGDLEVGESTRRFQAVVGELVAQRDRIVTADRRADSVSVESAS